MVGRHEDCHTSDSNTNGRQSKEESVAGQIGDNCQEYRETASSDSRWNGVELCLNLTVSIRLYYCGCKIGVGC